MLTWLLEPLEKRATQMDSGWEGWWHNQPWGKSASGISVTRDSALLLPAVWSCVSMISNDISMLPLDLYRKEGTDDADREIYRSHPSWRVVRWEANDDMTAKQFWRTILGDALLYNNGYARIYRGGDMRPVELIPLLPDRTERKYTRSGQVIYITEVDKHQISLDPYDVLHISGTLFSNPDGNTPNLLGYAREAIGLGLAAQKCESKFFKNGMRTSGILEVPRDLSKVAKDKVTEGFRQEYENDDSQFKVIVLRDGAKFHNVMQSQNDSQAHQLREDQVREVARIWRVPPSRLGLTDSVSYNSEAEANRKYHDSCLAPWLSVIADECWKKLLLPGERKALRLYFEHNTASLLRMNTLERFQAYALATDPSHGGRPWMLLSEVRKKENMPAIPGIDDPPEQPEPPQTQIETVEPKQIEDKRHTPGGVEHDQSTHGNWADGQKSVLDKLDEDKAEAVKGGVDRLPSHIPSKSAAKSAAEDVWFNYQKAQKAFKDRKTFAELVADYWEEQQGRSARHLGPGDHPSGSPQAVHAPDTGGGSGGGGTDQPRAKKGGEIGPNGEWYPGGAFIATTDMPKKAREKLVKIGTGKVQVEPYKWRVPEPGMISIFDRFAGTEANFNTSPSSVMEKVLDNQQRGPEYRDKLAEVLAAYDEGDRWVHVRDYPEFAYFKHVASLVVAGEPIPGDVLDEIPKEWHDRLGLEKAPPSRSKRMTNYVVCSDCGKPATQRVEDGGASVDCGHCKSTRQHYGHNEVRDKWLSENRHRYTLKQLVRKLDDMADEKEWTPLTTTRAIQIAIKRYRSFTEATNEQTIEECHFQ